MEKKIGIICNINNKYVILNDKKFINETSLLYTLLPNDVVEYKILNDKIEILKLIKREEQILMGIVKIIDKKECIISFPYLPKFFTVKISNQKNINLCSVLIIKIGLNELKVLNIYDSIKNRKNDLSLFINLYEEQVKLCNILPEYLNNTCYYTDEFKDLTYLETFNVDPIESKDFDDAISINHDENKIYVHIVDANEQINLLDENDINSLKHSFTLYLYEGVQNILPKKLAEDEMSLIEGKVRKTITIEFLIDKESQNIISHSIYKSIIKIKKRYNYNEFNKELNKFPMLLAFYNKWKRKTFNIPHLKMNIDKETGKIIDYNLESYFDEAHKIIETLMILTNLTVSEHVSSLIPQRYHSKVKLELDLKIFTGNNIIDSILTIKKFKPAIYDTLNKGHFGLDLKSYTHFTSPIRRYFDVIIHRLLAGISYNNIEDVLSHINNQERYIEKIVECYNNLKLLSYFEENLDMIWSGYILSIKNNGISVILEDNLYELFLFEIKPDLNLYDKVNVKINSINWISLNVKANII